MAYNNGVQIRPFDEAKGLETMGVRIGGVRTSVTIHHVSRETLNLPLKAKRVEAETGSLGAALACFSKRDERRRKRKARMRLRKLRGWH